MFAHAHPHATSVTRRLKAPFAYLRDFSLSLPLFTMCTSLPTADSQPSCLPNENVEIKIINWLNTQRKCYSKWRKNQCLYLSVWNIACGLQNSNISHTRIRFYFDCHSKLLSMNDFPSILRTIRLRALEACRLWSAQHCIESILTASSSSTDRSALIYEQIYHNSLIKFLNLLLFSWFLFRSQPRLIYTLLRSQINLFCFRSLRQSNIWLESCISSKP